MSPAVNMAALQYLLVGESKRMYQHWKLEGIGFDKMLVKLKKYARGQKLDGDASRGKQAVDMNWCHGEQSGTPEGAEGEEEDGTVNKVERVKCKYCKTFGHTADKCPKTKGKGGDEGAGAKGKNEKSDRSRYPVAWRAVMGAQFTGAMECSTASGLDSLFF